MTPGQLLGALAGQNVELFMRDGFLKFRAPTGVYTSELRALVAEHKHVLIDEWRCWQCQRIVTTLHGYTPILRCRECFLAWFSPERTEPAT